MPGLGQPFGSTRSRDQYGSGSAAENFGVLSTWKLVYWAERSQSALLSMLHHVVASGSCGVARAAAVGGRLVVAVGDDLAAGGDRGAAGGQRP